jgi:hypothetical protein
MFSLRFKPRVVKAMFVNKSVPPSQGPPSCKDCKWSVDNGKLCLLFQIGSNVQTFNTESLRTNIDLCGPDGMYFKPKNNLI